MPASSELEALCQSQKMKTDITRMLDQALAGDNRDIRDEAVLCKKAWRDIFLLGEEDED
jgi:cytochrome c-type biogenesis protein CcmH/NrfG